MSEVRVIVVGSINADLVVRAERLPSPEEAVRLLEREGIELDAVARLEAPTGVALIAVDAAGENQIAVAPGANAELDAAAVERAVRAAGAGAVLLSQEIPE